MEETFMTLLTKMSHYFAHLVLKTKIQLFMHITIVQDTFFTPMPP